MNSSPFVNAHNYFELLKRWRVLCRKRGLKIERVINSDGYWVYQIKSPALFRQNGVYISAGIHGDEVGAVEGLLRWAEQKGPELASLPLLLYPCLNPSGMAGNSRYCQKGKDLNRMWGGDKNRLTSAIQDRLRDMRFRLILNLHEDYDARGIYLYELIRGQGTNFRAEGILQRAEGLIHRDTRNSIEGKKARDGIIRPRPRNFLPDELPEALYLFRNHTDQSYTLETPSELDLEVRANTQVQMIDTALSS